MRNFKFTYLWIFLIVFLGGKIRSEVFAKNLTVTHKEQKKEFSKKLKKSADSAKAKYKYTRKKNKKPRGKRVAVLQISEDIFVGFFAHKSFKLPYTESVYTSFQHCFSLKRGPPVV
jgi:hypothetical protein